MLVWIHRHFQKTICSTICKLEVKEVFKIISSILQLCKLIFNYVLTFAIVEHFVIQEWSYNTLYIL